MDRKERLDSINDALLSILTGWQSDIYTAMPGIVESFDASSDTCSVQPAIKALVTSPVDGSQNWVDLPLLVDCPVYFPSGGGVTLTFPVSKGDECLVVFANRCIDAWWQSGDVQQQAVLRMHDLSDGFVYVGVRSQPNKIAVNTGAAQLRTDDGAAVVEVNPSSHAINITTSGPTNVTAGGTATVKAPSIILKNAGTALKKLVNDTFVALFNSHVHPTGSPNTGVPTTPMDSTNTTSVVEAE